MRRSIRNFNTPPPPGITRAFDCASCPGRGEFEHCVWRVGNLNRISLLFWCNTPVSSFGFFRVWWIYKTEFPLCQWIALSKGSLKEVWRCHYGISISLKSVQSVWLKTKFIFEERYFSSNWWGIWTAFLPRWEGIGPRQSSKVQMPGGCPGGDVELSNWSAHKG